MGIKMEKSRSLKIGEESYNDVLCIRLITSRLLNIIGLVLCFTKRCLLELGVDKTS